MTCTIALRGTTADDTATVARMDNSGYYYYSLSNLRDLHPVVSRTADSQQQQQTDQTTTIYDKRNRVLRCLQILALSTP